MSLIELCLIAIALSIDTLAISACIGLATPKFYIKNALIAGLYFGGFQAIMPILGYTLTAQFAGKVAVYSHWIAFGLLFFIGGKMIVESLKKESACQLNSKKISLAAAQMLPLSIATSIDALATGVSFAFIEVNIVTAALFIGITTFIISAVGVKVGSLIGTKFKSKAELAGGAILILIGLKILLEALT